MVLRTRRGLVVDPGGGEGSDPLAYEIVQEKAANLQRLGRRLEAGLQALRDFDASAAGRPRTAADAETRERLLDEAGESLWYYVVQREVSGLRDTEGALRELGVPREVRLRMGLPSARRGR